MAAEFVPDLVVLDLGLPKLDGVDAAGSCARRATCRS